MANDLLTQNNEDELMSEINMTPLIDVMLVLLIIFMITLPVINQATKINLPHVNAQPSQTQAEPIKIVIRADGAIFWQQQPIDQTALRARLAAAAQANPLIELHLYADRVAHYEYVTQVIAAAQISGLTKISLVTQPQAKKSKL